MKIIIIRETRILGFYLSSGEEKQSFFGHGLGKKKLDWLKVLAYLPNFNLSLVWGEGSTHTIARLSASI